MKREALVWERTFYPEPGMRLASLRSELGCARILRLMDKILHDPKDPKLWELWYIPYYGSCRILSISRMDGVKG